MKLEMGLLGLNVALFMVGILSAALGSDSWPVMVFVCFYIAFISLSMWVGNSLQDLQFQIWELDRDLVTLNIELSNLNDSKEGLEYPKGTEKTQGMPLEEVVDTSELEDYFGIGDKMDYHKSMESRHFSDQEIEENTNFNKNRKAIVAAIQKAQSVKAALDELDETEIPLPPYSKEQREQVNKAEGLSDFPKETRKPKKKGLKKVAKKAEPKKDTIVQSQYSKAPIKIEFGDH